MKYAIGPILTACLALCTVFATGDAGRVPAVPTAVPAPAAHDAVTGVQPLEVRLRKLHLVRPDLQRFPIPYDTVC